MIGDPPLDTGAVHDTVADEVPATAVPIVGAAGTVAAPAIDSDIPSIVATIATASSSATGSVTRARSVSISCEPPVDPSPEGPEHVPAPVTPHLQPVASHLQAPSRRGNDLPRAVATAENPRPTGPSWPLERRQTPRRTRSVRPTSLGRVDRVLAQTVQIPRGPGASRRPEHVDSGADDRRAGVAAAP